MTSEQARELLKSRIYNESGKAINMRFTEKWISANHPEIYSIILKDTENYALEFNHKILIWVKNIIKHNVCKTCGVELIKIYRGNWAEYCSRKCCQDDIASKRKMDGTLSYSDSIVKRNKTMQEKYGTLNPREVKKEPKTKSRSATDDSYLNLIHFPIDEIRSRYIKSQDEIRQFISNNTESPISITKIDDLKKMIEVDEFKLILKSCYFDSAIVEKKPTIDQATYIWDDEWIHNRSKIEKFILNRLIRTERIGARKTEVVELSQEKYSAFLEDNHMQGSTPTKYRFGLMYGDQLVSVMGFCNIQRNRARLLTYGDNGYELVRFANKNVVGAFAKLLNHFKKIHKAGFISSFADLEIVSESNNIYLKNGFSEAYRIPPDYKYFSFEGGLRRHKFNFRKVRFAKMGFDIEGKTESELAVEAKLLRCYDLGKIQYILKTEESGA